MSINDIKCGLWWKQGLNKLRLYHKTANLLKLYLHAISRNISIDKNPSDICLDIQSELPSKEWTEKAVQTFLKDDEQRLVSQYTEMAFVRMNDELRKNPKSLAPINNIIEKMPPLDKEVIVYRYLDSFDFLPQSVGDIFVSNGYLSTSLDALFIRQMVCDAVKDKRGAMLKIILPVGTKVLYVPNHEAEFILPHGLNLRLLGYTKGKIVCTTEDFKECYIQDKVPVFEFIALRQN